MSDLQNRLCRGCQHWEPLLTGEAWGVRSFVDAPAEAQAEIKARLAADDHSIYPAGGKSDEIPGGTDWPEWGECSLTKLDSEAAETSLARAIDGSMYMAVLRCHANFGCVQWEAVKDEPGCGAGTAV